MGLLNDLTLTQIFTRLAAFLIVIAVHGLALAGFAALLGDEGPKHEGRLTPNPLAQLSVVGLALAILFQIGWMKPLPVDPARLRAGRPGLVLCLLGSLLAVLAIIPLFSLIGPVVATSFPRSTTLTLLAVLETTKTLAAWFVVFNMLPLPIVTGSLLLVAVAPPLSEALRKYQVYLMAGMAVLVATRIAEAPLASLTAALLRFFGA